MSAEFRAGEILQTSVDVSQDTFLRQGHKNKSQGDWDMVRIRKSGKNRAFVSFDSSSIETALDGGTLLSASLELTISDNGNNWGDGRTIDAHRVTQAWTEGDATWNCAIDSDLSNQAADCEGATEWEMGNAGPHPWESVPTDSATIVSQQTGTVSFDVTADVQAFLDGTATNHGWVIKKTEEGQNGRIEFETKEAGLGAELVLEFESSKCTGVLEFADPGLEGAVRDALSMPTGDITDADVAGLSVLDAANRGISDLGGIECLGDLDRLSLWSNDVTDTSPLAELTSLTELTLAYNDVTDISTLGSLVNLEHFDLRLNQVVDVSVMSAWPNLEVFIADGNPVASIASLSGAAQLSLVSLWATDVIDISALANKPHLDTLNIGYTDVADISSLAASTAMRRLHMLNANVGDISVVAGMSGLEEFLADVNPIGDISALSGLSQLRWVNLWSTQLTDISALANKPLLETVNVGDNQLTDISALAGSPAIDFLQAERNQLTDISVVSGMPALRRLWLSSNSLSDLSPISGLQDLEYLTLAVNQVADLAPLAGLPSLSHVDLYGNSVASVSPLLSVPNLSTGDLRNNGLACDDNGLIQLAIRAPGVQVDSCVQFDIAFLSEAVVAGGSLGGIAAADAICQAEADAAGLQGTFLAWMSDETQSPSTRFNQAAGPYHLTNGDLVATDWADLTDGALPTLARIAVTAQRDGISGSEDGECRVWTGTLSNGTLDGARHCGNWTNLNTNGGVGFWDSPNGGGWCDSSIPSQWSGGNASNWCDQERRLYCFSQ